MSKTIKIVTLAVIALLVSSCGKNEVIQYNDYNSYSLIKSWNINDFPLIIEIPAELSDYQSNIIAAGEVWNQSLGFTAFSFIFNQIPNVQWGKKYDSLNDSIFGIYQESNWAFPDLEPSILAYTAYTSRNSRIINADILFNFKNYKFATYNDPSIDYSNYIDFQTVLVHELGHFLGLNHTKAIDDPSSVMLPSIKKGEVKRKLSSLDILTVKNLYSQQ